MRKKALIKRLRSTQCLVVGGSAGSLGLVSHMMRSLDESLISSLVIVLHIAPSENLLSEYLGKYSRIPVKEAESTEKMLPGRIYLAPAEYHLSIEENLRFSLSTEPPVNFSRPSIDVLFCSAAQVFADRLCGVLLSGANSDGAEGLKVISMWGGLTLVQDPKDAEYPLMPTSALKLFTPDAVLNRKQMVELFKHLPRASDHAQGEALWS